MERRSPRASRTNSSRSWTPRLGALRSEEHTSELQTQSNLVCRLLLENKELSQPAKKLNTTKGPNVTDRRALSTSTAPMKLSIRKTVGPAAQSGPNLAPSQTRTPIERL